MATIAEAKVQNPSIGDYFFVPLQLCGKGWRQLRMGEGGTLYKVALLFIRIIPQILLSAATLLACAIALVGTLIKPVQTENFHVGGELTADKITMLNHAGTDPSKIEANLLSLIKVSHGGYIDMVHVQNCGHRYKNGQQLLSRSITFHMNSYGDRLDALAAHFTPDYKKLEPTKELANFALCTGYSPECFKTSQWCRTITLIVPQDYKNHPIYDLIVERKVFS